MQPTRTLVEEHDVILTVLECLQRLAHAAEREGALDAGAAARALDFLRTFADRCHHGKEEGVLFPALERRGLPRHVGPIAVMLGDHEVGRSLIARMAAAVAGAQNGVPDSARAFARPALQYVDMLRDHIAKENEVLFPMAESLFQGSDAQDVAAAFARAERDDLGAGAHERYLAVARELCAQFGVDPQAVARPGAGCGHGGHDCAG